MVTLNPDQFTYRKETKEFLVSGKKVKFATSYLLKNTKTGGTMKFDFKESTGSEWEPDTLWIYKSKDGFTLNLTNEDVTPEHEQAYLETKLRK